MKYAASFFIVLGLAIVGGAETQDWLPMFIAQIGLGAATLFAGYLFTTQIGDNDA
jgi:hypothetical protein